MNKRLLAMTIMLVVVLVVVVIGIYFIDPRLQFPMDRATVPNRLLFVVIGLLIAFAVYYLTRENSAWEVGTRQVVWMAIGAALYAVFSFIFNSSVFVVPSVSQVALRPAIAIPMFFGYTFGPVVGFFTGAVGNMFGDALTGFGLSPQWSIGNGLVGFIAGLPLLFGDRKKNLDTVLWVSGVLVALVVALFLLNRSVQNQLYFANAEPVSLLIGLALLIGFILVLAVRFLPSVVPGLVGFLTGSIILVSLLGFAAGLLKFNVSAAVWIVVILVGGLIGLWLSLRFTAAFGKSEDIRGAVIWGMLGNILGIGFAALSDIVINKYSPAVAIVGEFVPAAGPNLIFAAILVPMLVVAYSAVQRQSGR